MLSNATGKRKVRCPKCTAMFAEPQAQIYECPICSTYLLAKGYGLSNTSGSNKPLNVNGGEAQKITDGMSKVQKAGLCDNDAELLRDAIVESETNGAVDRENTLRSEGPALSDQSIQNLSNHGLPNKICVPSELSSESNPEKPGELSSGHASIRQSSDLDSESRDGSEGDSPLWSPENVKPSGAPQVSSFANSREDSSGVQSSSELMSNLAGGCTRRQAEEETSPLRSDQNDDEHIVQHKNLIKDVNKKAYENHIIGVGDSESTASSKASSEIALLTGALAKETAKKEDCHDNGDCKGKGGTGKFRFFDLSVFGIYNEEAYDVLRQGYPITAESNVDGDSVELPNRNELSPELPSVTPVDLSSDEEDFGADGRMNMGLSEKHKGGSKSSVSDDDSIHTGTADNVDIKVKDAGTRMLDFSVREAENADAGSLNDEKTLPADVDDLDKAPDGEDLYLRELNSESTSVDISFGGWQSLPFSTALKLDSEYSDHEKGMRNSGTEEDTDSSWNDDEESPFSRPAKGSFKFEVVSSMDGGNVGGDESEITSTTDKPAFPPRTTAMQKYLKKDNDQQSASHAHSHGQVSERVMKSESALYEAPYTEQYLAAPVNVPQEALHQAVFCMPIQEDSKALTIREPENRVESKPAANEIDLQAQSMANAPALPSLSVKRSDVSPDSEYGENYGTRSPRADHRGFRDGLEIAASSQEDGGSQKTDSTRLKTADMASQKLNSINELNPSKQENAARSPASLRFEGREGSIWSASSTTVYGSEKNLFREGSPGSDGRLFPARIEGQYPREPVAVASPRPQLGTDEASLRKLATVEPASSRRTAESRPPIPNQVMVEESRVRREEKKPDSEGSMWTDFGWRAGHRALYLGSGLSPTRELQDQLSSQFSHGTDDTMDYGSGRSSRTQDVPSYSNHVAYLPNPQDSASNAGARAYPLQLPPHRSAAVTASQEDRLSQFFSQHSQSYQTMMPPQCAACTAQASTAIQAMHPDMYGHHMPAFVHSNHTSRHNYSTVSSAESSGLSRSHIGHNNLTMPARRRMKRYPLLPGKAAPPYVLCRHCDLLLQVTEYLSASSGSVQKLICGACGKASKFSIPGADIHSSRLPTRPYDRDDFVAIDKQQMDTTRVYSSRPRSSGGDVSSAQNMLRKGRLPPGQGMQEAWIENRVTKHSNAHGASLMQPDLTGDINRIKPLAVKAGSRQAGYVPSHTNGKHAFNDNGSYGEDFSSSPSSASGTSPGRLSQVSQDNQQARPLVRASRGQNLSPELLPLTSVYNQQGRSPPGSPGFSEGFWQKGVSENQRGSVLDSPPYSRLEMYYNKPTSGSWQIESADGNSSGLNSPRSHIERAQKSVVASASPLPLVEQISHGFANNLPSPHHRQRQTSSGIYSRSSSSPRSDSQVSPREPYSRSDSGERSTEGKPSQLHVQNSVKGTTSFAGFLKKSFKDLSRGGQGGNRRKVSVNGHLIPEAAVRKAEEKAGPIHSGSYWYDYQVGFWGLLGGPCLGIIMPFIEEFHFPLARDCARGRTGILVNGRELHEEDLGVLSKRGLPTTPGKAYILDISGALFDDISGRSLKGLGKLAPSIEKRGQGFGMSPLMPVG